MCIHSFRRAGLGCAAVTLLLPALAFAQEVPFATTVSSAPRSMAEAATNLELAELRRQRFDRIDFPRAQRSLDAQIELAEAEIASLKRRVKQYERFTHNVHSSPLFLTLEETRLALLEAELQRKQLRSEKCLQIQYKGTTRRIYQLEADQARTWMQRFTR